MNLEQLLGDEADSLLNHVAKAFPAEHLTLPGPDHLDEIFIDSDRSSTVLRNLGTLYNTGRLAGTGYLSILPVDQGIEHSAAASFAKFPAYFDPAKLCDLAIAADCNAIATTLGGLGIVSRRYVHKIPFIVKLNHNDFLNYPNTYDQVMFGRRGPGLRPRCRGGGGHHLLRLRGGRPPDRGGVRGLRRGPPPGHVHRAVVLPAQPGLQAGGHRLPPLRRPHRPGQPPRGDHRGRHHQAEAAREQRRLQRPLVRQDRPAGLRPAHHRPPRSTSPAGRSSTATPAGSRSINSGGESKGADDLAQAVRTAVVNKRAGGRGLIVGRKAFQRPTDEGAALIHAIQDVYLDPSVTVA